MSNHYIALNRGQSGFAETDFTIGTSSSASSSVELRVADAANLSRQDVVLLIDQMKRWVTMNGLTSVLPNASV